MKNGEKNKLIPGWFDSPKFLEVCRLLNEEEADYIVIGGWACGFHGLIRATKDIDLLIPKNVENTRKVLKALGELTFGIAKELDAETVTKKPFTIIGDTPRVDLLTIGGKVRYADALPSSIEEKLAGVRVRFPDLKTLIKSKTTDRLQDKADVERLRLIAKNAGKK